MLYEERGMLEDQKSGPCMLTGTEKTIMHDLVSSWW
jgi:hypothetical protein